MSKIILSILVFFASAFGAYTIADNISDNTLFGATVLFPYQGGTGTGTAPSEGQILVGQSDGKYTPTSTINGDLSVNGGLTIIDTDDYYYDLSQQGVEFLTYNSGFDMGDNIISFQSPQVKFWDDAGDASIEILGSLYVYNGDVIDLDVSTTSVSGVLGLNGDYIDNWLDINNYGYWTDSGTALYPATTTRYLGIGTSTPDSVTTIKKPDAFDYVATYYLGATSTNTTEAKITAGTAYIVGVHSSTEYMWVGKNTTFSEIYFDIATAGSSVSYAWQYSQGSGVWADLTVTNGTTNFSVDGSVTFTPPVDWATDTVDSYTGYLVRVRPTSDPATHPTAYLTVPNTTNVLSVYANAGDTTAAFRINEQGNIGIATAPSNSYKLSLSGGTYFYGTHTQVGAISQAGSSIGTNRTTGIQSYAATAATEAVPVQYSPVFLQRSRAWETGTTTDVAYLQSTSTATYETAPSDVAFSIDGLKMFVLGDTGDDITYSTLGTAWNVSTASYVSQFAVDTGTSEDNPQGFYFKSDGLKFWVVGYDTDAVYQYSMSSAWDMSTAAYDSVSFSVSAQEATPLALYFKPDGTQMYVMGSTGDDVNIYNLSTAWDITSAVYSTVFSVAGQESGPTAIEFSQDGYKMYVYGSTGDDVNVYRLGVAWDVTTAAYRINYAIAAETSPSGIAWRPNGLKMYTVGTTLDAVREYDVVVPWELNTTAVDTYLNYFSQVKPVSANPLTGLREDGVYYGASEYRPFWNWLSDGKVGFGTSTPNYKLSIQSDNALENLLQVGTTTNTNILVVSSGGKVGINTSTPTYSLDVSGDFRAGSTTLATTTISGYGTTTTYQSGGAILTVGSTDVVANIELFTTSALTVPMINSVDSTFGETYTMINNGLYLRDNDSFFTGGDANIGFMDNNGDALMTITAVEDTDVMSFQAANSYDFDDTVYSPTLWATNNLVSNGGAYLGYGTTNTNSCLIYTDSSNHTLCWSGATTDDFALSDGLRVTGNITSTGSVIGGINSKFGSADEYVYFDTYDYIGGDALVLPRINFKNNNGLGLDTNLGTIEKGLLVTDTTAGAPLIAMAGSSLLQPYGNIEYLTSTQTFTFKPDMSTSTTYNLTINGNGYSDVIYPTISGVNSEGDNNVMIRENLILASDDTNPFIAFVNESTDSYNIFTIDDNGLLSLGGFSAITAVTSTETGHKEAFLATGAFVAPSLDTKICTVYKDSYNDSGFARLARMGEICGVKNEIGEDDWIGGITIETYSTSTGSSTPVTRANFKPLETDLYAGTSTNRYFRISEVDLTASEQGDLGYYSMLGGYSEGSFGNIGLWADAFSVYDTQDDDLTSVNFVGNNVLSIGQIEYDNQTYTFNFAELLGDANVNIEGLLDVQGTGTSTIAGNLEVTGKITATGGIDPPYVSYTDESCDSIRKYHQDGVKDNVMQFWNAENRRFEYYLADEDECYPLGYQGEAKLSFWDKLINLIKSLWTKN